jgi:hypothetical protein
MKSLTLFAAAVAGVLLVSVAGAAGAGALDPSFGTGGVATLSVPGSFYDGVNDTLVQPDGKIVLAGGVNRGEEPAASTSPCTAFSPTARPTPASEAATAS